MWWTPLVQSFTPVGMAQSGSSRSGGEEKDKKTVLMPFCNVEHNNQLSWLGCVYCGPKCNCNLTTCDICKWKCVF